MLQRLKLGVVFVALAAAPLVGCASGGGRRDPDRVYVRMAPPPPREEVVIESPGREYVWVRGHWAWRGSEYEWVPGRWDRADRGRRWAEGRWVHERGGWYYIEGHWR